MSHPAKATGNDNVPALITSELRFTLNDSVQVIKNPNSNETLFDYLQSPNVGLLGTKTGCKQGGCGACTVMVSKPVLDKDGKPTNKVVHEAVNSCLRPVCSLHGQVVTTVEGVANPAESVVAPVQDKIVKHSATQCGYCTPGWVMSGHSFLLQKFCEKKTVSCADIEDMADGNLCRCTGNRPLLTALKDLATSEPFYSPKDGKECRDHVEEAEVPIHWRRSVAKWEDLIPPPCEAVPPLEIKDNGGQLKWKQASSLVDLITTLKNASAQDKFPQPIAGNTGVGIYPDKVPAMDNGKLTWKTPTSHVDMANVPELNVMKERKERYTIGAAVTYTKFIEFLDARLSESACTLPTPEERRLRALRYLAQRTAGRQLRNRSTLGGNTMMVALHYQDPANPPFPSDLLVGLLALQTEVIVHTFDNQKIRLPLDKFIAGDARLSLGKFILVKYHIPKAPAGNDAVFTQTYKTAVRHTMAHSYTNAGITFEFTKGLISKAVLAFGGIGHTRLAEKTAAFLVGKPLVGDVLLKSCQLLKAELTAWAKATAEWKERVKANHPWNGEDEKYLIDLGVGYLYKFMVMVATCTGVDVDKNIQDIGLPDVLPVNYAHVTYESKATKKWKKHQRTCSESLKAKALSNSTGSAEPEALSELEIADELAMAHKPIVKLEAYQQATGEVVFYREHPAPGRSVYFSWVYTRKIGNFKYSWDVPTQADKEIEALLGPRSSYPSANTKNPPVNSNDPASIVLPHLQFLFGSANALRFITHQTLLDAKLNANFELGSGRDDIVDEMGRTFEGETLLLKNCVSNAVGERIGLVVGATEAVTKKMAEFIMLYCVQYTDQPKDIKLKLEDYQKDPSAAPNPDEWKPYRMPFPGGGVQFPENATRDYHDFEKIGKPDQIERVPVQNVIERPIEDSRVCPTWYQDMVKAAELPAPERFITLPVTTNDGLQETAKCYVVKADHRTHEQIHWYLEQNAVIAEPSHGGLILHMSTQSPSECQQKVCGILGVKNNMVDIQVKQLGGGYGGKTVRSAYQACAAAVVAKIMGRPAKLAIEREADSAVTGRRHAYFMRVYLAVMADDKPNIADQRGKIVGFYMQAWSDMGLHYDCAETVLNVAIEDVDGSYFTPLFRADGQLLRTNKIPNTAMRAFGHASIMSFENAIEAAGHCKYIFDKDGSGNSTSIRIRSLYRLGQSTPYGSVLSDYVLDKMYYNMRSADWYQRRIATIRDFNNSQRWRKRGHCLQPAKYKVGYEFGSLEQGHAIVNVFMQDGSVIVMHDGVEIGQGLSTKVIQIAANELKLPIDLIQIGTTGSKVTPNATSTGASSGSEIKGGATRNACNILRTRLENWCLAFYNKNKELVACGEKPLEEDWEDLAFWTYKNGWADYLRDKKDPSVVREPKRRVWESIVVLAWKQRVDLSAEGFYTNPYFNANPSSAVPQVYAFVYGCAYSEVEIDVLTGETILIETRLVVDAGKSMNPAVDIGQIEGSFMQGVGSILTENVIFEPSGEFKGRMNADNTWTYKPPFPRDIPLKWWTNIFPSEKYNVRLNPNLVMSSKSMGEPPFVLSTSVYCALKEAIFAARLQNKHVDEWFMLPIPCTPQNVRELCLVDENSFIFKSAAPTPESERKVVPMATNKLLTYVLKRKLGKSHDSLAPGKGYGAVPLTNSYDAVPRTKALAVAPVEKINEAAPAMDATNQAPEEEHDAPPPIHLVAALNRNSTLRGKYDERADILEALKQYRQSILTASK